MRSRVILSVAICLLISTLPCLASAGEQDDPAALLRRARVADEVEKDTEQALALYARVWALAPQTPLGLHAGLRLSQLLEDKAKVLDLLKDLTERHTSRMSDEQKRQVHGAMAALLEPGQNAMTPLGTVFVRGESDSRSARSPVELMIAQIFRAHNIRALPLRKNSSAAYRDLDEELEALGEPGRVVLARMVDEGHPDEAYSAAILLQRADAVTALRGYARAIRTGRADFRARVVQAAQSFINSPEVSPTMIATFLPLLELEHIKDVHNSIVQLLAKHMTDEQLIEQRNKTSELRWTWANVALGRGLPEAVALLTKEAAAGDAPEWAIDVLRATVSQRSQVNAQNVYKFDTDQLDTETLATLFRLSVDAQAHGNPAKSFYLWKRLGAALRKRGVWEPLRSAVWRRVFDHDDARVRSALIGTLHSARDANEPVVLPEEIFTTEEDWDRLAGLLGARDELGRAVVRGPWMRTHVPLWRAVLKRVRKADKEQRIRMYQGITEALGYEVPEALWPQCMAYVAELDHSEGYQGTPQWIWLAAGKTADPRLLDILRNNLAFLHTRTNVRTALLAYQNSGGKGVIEFCKHVLAAKVAGLDDWALTALHRSKDPAGWDHLESIANTTAYRNVIVALLDAADPRQRDVLMAYCAQAARGEWDGKPFLSARNMLVKRAEKFRLREAVPFLVREYEEEASNEVRRSEVMGAMDAIRDHHERLEFFQSWGSDEDGEEKVLSMLSDEDAAIRRAAVMSLAALQGPGALPRLLEIAKTDKDEGVRKAALEAIERVATASKLPPATTEQRAK